MHKAELDSGYGELNQVQSDLSSLIDLSVRELKSFAALRGHSIKLDIHDSLIIIFDNEQIRHVLNNLITNAIKYTPKGFIKIIVEHQKVFVLINQFCILQTLSSCRLVYKIIM